MAVQHTVAWPKELENGILDSILEDTLVGHPPITLMVVKKCVMGNGQRAVVLLTDGGSKYPNPRNQRYIVRCILKADDGASHCLAAGTLTELTHWVCNTVAKQSEKILIALSVKAVGQFDGLDLSNLDSLFVKHPLNVLQDTGSTAPPQQPTTQQPSEQQTNPYNNNNVTQQQTNPYNNNNVTQQQTNPYNNNNVTQQQTNPYNNNNVTQHQTNPNQEQRQSDASWGPMARKNPIASPQRSAPYGNAGPVVRRDDANFVPIRGLNSYIARWTIKARVSSKGDMRTYTNARGEGKLFSADLVDNADGEIRATFFNKAADKFYALLVVDQVYSLSKGVVKQADKRFNSLSHSCELQFGEDADIKPVEEDASIPKKKYNVTKIADMGNFKKNDTVDLIAVIVGYSPISQITLKATGQGKDKREWTLLDDSCCQIDITLWGDKTRLIDESILQRHPIIAIKGARVDEFQGRKLSTGFATSIDVNMFDLPEVAKLATWYEQYGKTVQPQSLSGIMNTARDEKRFTLAEIIESATAPQSSSELEDKGLWFSAVATLILIDTSRNYFWTACPTCNKKVKDSLSDDSLFDPMGVDGSANGDVGGNRFFCSNCDKPVDKPMRKFLLNCELKDPTDCLKCIAMAEYGKALLGVDVDTIENIRYNNNVGPGGGGESSMEECGFDDFFFWKYYQEYVFKIQAKAETFNDERRIKYRLFGADLLVKHLSTEAEKRISFISQTLNLPQPPPSMAAMTPSSPHQTTQVQQQIGNSSFAGGNQNFAGGNQSFAGGNQSFAGGNPSFAGGIYPNLAGANPTQGNMGNAMHSGMGRTVEPQQSWQNRAPGRYGGNF